MDDDFDVCDICNDETATRTLIDHAATFHDPAEYVAVCDQCEGPE